MDLAKAVHIVTLMLAPSLIVGAAVWLPRGYQLVDRLVREHRLGLLMRPAGPPIEQIAADLRRMLRLHESLRRSNKVFRRAHHLRALEAAITECAADATRALGLPAPDNTSGEPLPVPELRVVLQSIADAGIVLPPLDRFAT
jgi:hypothetical protein